MSETGVHKSQNEFPNTAVAWQLCKTSPLFLSGLIYLSIQLLFASSCTLIPRIPTSDLQT